MPKRLDAPRQTSDKAKKKRLRRGGLQAPPPLKLTPVFLNRPPVGFRPPRRQACRAARAALASLSCSIPSLLLLHRRCKQQQLAHSAHDHTVFGVAPFPFGSGFKRLLGYILLRFAPLARAPCYSHGIRIRRTYSQRTLLSLLARKPLSSLLSPLCGLRFAAFPSPAVAQDFTKCMQDDGTKQPSQCKLLAEDYVECLHHHKQVRLL